MRIKDHPIRNICLKHRIEGECHRITFSVNHNGKVVPGTMKMGDTLLTEVCSVDSCSDSAAIWETNNLPASIGQEFQRQICEKQGGNCAGCMLWRTNPTGFPKPGYLLIAKSEIDKETAYKTAYASTQEP